ARGRTSARTCVKARPALSFRGMIAGGRMRKYWSQVAMLLLGISLTMSFYEGRKLVHNTAKALTAATSISGSASGSRRRGEGADATDGGDPDGGDQVVNDEDRGDRRHRVPRADRVIPVLHPSIEARMDLAQRGNLLRQRQRLRLAGRPGG